MKIYIKSFQDFHSILGGQTEFEKNTRLLTIRDVVNHFIEKHGSKFQDLVFNPATGKMRQDFTVLVNGRGFRRDLDSRLQNRDVLILMVTMAGG